MGYAVRASLVPPIVTNCVLLGSAALILPVLSAEKVPGMAKAYGLVAVAAVVMGFGFLFVPNAVMGSVSAVLSALVNLPQTVTALRTDDLSGLSRSTWAIGAFGSCLWTTYGIGNHSWPMLLASAEGAILSAIVLARIVAVERRRDLLQAA
jgi:uncharacterized protein with PQ loop repeat